MLFYVKFCTKYNKYKEIYEMKKWTTNIKHWGVHLTNINNPIVDNIFGIINQTKAPVFLFITVLFYCLGIIINEHVPFPQFNLFHTLFTGILVVAFLSVRYFEKQMKEIHRLMASDNALYPINDKIYRFRHSTLNLIVPPLAGGFFGVLALMLVNINVNSLSAIYLIFTYIACVLISFVGYLQYIYLYIYIWKLGSNTKRITMYNKEYPSNTKWVVSLAKLYGNYRNIFFILGAAYVFGVIYFVLCGDYMVIEKIAAHEGYVISLILFWGSVFLAIVVFFPISSVIEYFNIKKIVDNLKNQTVVELNKIVPEHSQSNETKIQKSYLIIAITNTPDYPFKDRLGIIFSTIITFVNFSASVVAILEYTFT